MHLDTYESIWLKRGMMIDTVELYILILIYVTFTVIQGQQNGRKQTLLHQLSYKVFVWIEWNFLRC